MKKVSQIFLRVRLSVITDYDNIAKSSDYLDTMVNFLNLIKG
jgi:hypothetical protein